MYLRITLLLVVLLSAGCVTAEQKDGNSHVMAGKYKVNNQPEKNSSTTSSQDVEIEIEKLIRDIDKKAYPKHSLLSNPPPYNISIEKLATIGRPAVPYLIMELGNHNHSRGYAAMALGRIGPDAGVAVPDLIKLLDYAPHRYDAIEALGNIGDKSKAAVVPLRRILREMVVSDEPAKSKLPSSILGRGSDEKHWSSESDIDQAAAIALGKIGDKSALDDLISVLKRKGNQWEYVRAAAAKALGLLADDSAIDALSIAINDPIKDVRYEAVKSLGKINKKEVIPPLITALNDEHDHVRGLAMGAISELSGEIEAGSYVSMLVATLKTSEQDTKQTVVDVLRFRGFPELEEVRRQLELPKIHVESPMWERQYPGESINHVQHDEFGNLVFAGRVLVYLDVGGDELWRINKIPMNEITGYYLANDGSLLVAGRYKNSLILLKINQQGEILWKTKIDNIRAEHDRMESITVSKNGEILVLGTTRIEGQYIEKVFLAVFGDDGNLMHFASDDNGNRINKEGINRNIFVVPGYMYISRLVIQSDGKSFIIFEKGGNSSDMKLGYFDEVGGLIWAVDIARFDPDKYLKILLDTNGNIYVVGADESGRSVIEKIDSGGEEQWKHQLNKNLIRAATLVGGHLFLAQNTYPITNLFRIYDVDVSDGSLVTTHSIAYRSKHEGTGYIQALSVDPEGRMNVVVDFWQNKIKKDGRVSFISPVSVSFGFLIERKWSHIN